MSKATKKPRITYFVLCKKVKHIWGGRIGGLRAVLADMEAEVGNSPQTAPPARAAAGQGRFEEARQKPARDRFSFAPGQVMFDGKDLRLPAGLCVDVVKALLKDFGRAVMHKYPHDESRPSEASPELRTAVATINDKLRAAKAPCRVLNKRGSGYLLE